MGFNKTYTLIIFII